MKDDLENTKALNELETITKDDTIIYDSNDKEEDETQEELYNNLVSQENTIEYKKEEIIEDSKEEKKKKKRSLKEIWNNLSKKKKIIVIVSAVLIVCIIIMLIIILCRKDIKEDNVKVDDVIIQKDNYIYENGKLVLLDKDEKEIGEYECSNKDADLCYVAYLGNDEDPFEVAVNTYEDGTLIKSRAPIYLNRYAFIVDQDNKNSDIIFLYDITDKKVIDEYQKVKAYSNSNNYVVLENKNGEYGLFELKDSGLNELISFKYTFLGLNKNDTSKVVAKDTNGFIILGFNGTSLSKSIPGEIVNYNDKFIVAKNYGKYTLYDYEGVEYQSNVDYIRIINDNYYAMVQDKLLYIRDKDNNKYNEEGYQINNDKYIPVNIFDKNDKKIKTEEAFTIELNGDVFNIVIGDSTNLLSMLDGLTSTNYQFYSYFAGKLYFYSDSNKLNLLGTYTCANKNEKIKDDRFVNCYVAKDSVFNRNYKSIYKERNTTIPLYNNKYVFIYDSPTLANDDNTEIKFYDLSQNKVNGTYAAIDSDTNDNNGVFTHAGAQDKEIIAKSKNGKYGTIIIDNAGARINYKMEYKHLEKYDKYYIAKQEDDSWIVIYSSKETSYDFPGKIMGDNEKYFVIQNEDDEEVKVYPNEKNAKPINDKSFKYVVLDKDIYAAVDSKNKLWIYQYSSDKPLNEKGIKLDGDEYYSADIDDYPFNLSMNNTKTSVNVYVLDGKKYVLEETLEINKEGNNHEGEE